MPPPPPPPIELPVPRDSDNHSFSLSASAPRRSSLAFSSFSQTVHEYRSNYIDHLNVYENDAIDDLTPLSKDQQPQIYGSITNNSKNSYIQSRRSSLSTPIIPSRSNLSLSQHDLLIPQNNNDSLSLKEPQTDYSIESYFLLKYSPPLVLTFLLQYSLTIASVFSVGQLGKNELAAVSLASMTANITGYAPIQGVSTCLDTLCAQAYGRKDYRMVGLHFLRCTFFLLIVFVPVALIWIVYSESILLSIIPEKDLCYLASNYLTVLCLGVPGYILFENGKHYLQAQGIFHASTVVLMICAPLNAFLNWLLVWHSKFGLGFIGAPIAVSITNWLMALLLLLYSWRIKGYQCWSGFSWDCFKNWSRMLKLSAGGVLMLECEWFCFEIITLSTSRFGTVSLAAQSIISNVCVMTYQIPFAIAIVASTRIANFIGANSKNCAKKATYTSLIFGGIIGVFTAILLSVFRTPIARAFSNDQEVIDLAARVLIIGATYQINDSINAVAAGILRAQGKQHIGATIYFVSYYLIALPVAFFFAFHVKLELFGLWIGMVIALFFASIFQTYFVLYADWDAIIDDCIQEAILEGHESQLA
ncbi:MATE family efflux transporter [Ascoidea rubescens DSM 1968]|uniref:MATE efflux family protein n=1 Tax=Ascoidea rubescens DSM 1968 TaxID=1344418 RepID=A0A1D2VAF6_9ASCO|nr:MATE efflux family protein [Ascoidea rubescens DSM 1968]ODV58648.1 MATE efflux family protein [Ascoidea rubescens DSM 1968]